MTSTVLTDVLKAKTTNGSLTISGNGTGNVDMKNLATTDDTPMVLTLQTGETDMAANDIIGAIQFQAPDEGTGTDAILVSAAIKAFAEGDHSSSSNATRLEFMTGSSEAATSQMTVTSGGIVGIGAVPIGDLGVGLHIKTSDTGGSVSANSDELVLEGAGNAGLTILSQNDSVGQISFGDGDATQPGIIQYAHGDNTLEFYTAGSRRVEIDGSGHFMFATTDSSLYNNGASGNAGIMFDGALASGNTPMQIAGESAASIVANRMTNDGAILTFMQNGTEEGSVSVSGSTIAYNAFAGCHPAQWSSEQETPARGSVISSANVLAEWRKENLYDALTDKHLKVLDGRTTEDIGTRVNNTDAVPATYSLVELYNNIRLPKVKLSDESGDKSVYGVFDRIDQETNNVMVMALGAFVSLVTGACASGDLLESNGDGTAKVQSDDVIRSSTLGKVTVGKDDAAVGLVPCVLYCG